MGDVTREEMEKALTKFQGAATSYGISFGMDCPVKEKLDDLADARANVLSLFDAAIRQAREGALEEAAVIAEDLAEHGTHIAEAIRGLAKGAE